MDTLLNSNPIVTVYIPTFNRVELLKRAVESVRNQTYQNIEIIIVDDCSSDGTIEYLQAVSKQDRRIRYFLKEKNSGACASRNIAIENANGEFITGLDDDDYFLSSRIENFIQHKAFLNAYVFIFDTLLYKKNDKVFKDKFASFFPDIVDFNSIIYGNYIGNQIFCELKVLKKNNGFDINLAAWQDLDKWLNLLAEGKNGKRIDGATYIVDIDHAHERITSLNKGEKIREAFNYISNKYKLNNKLKRALSTQLFSYGNNVKISNFLFYKPSSISWTLHISRIIRILKVKWNIEFNEKK